MFDRQATIAVFVVLAVLAGGRVAFQVAIDQLNIYLDKEAVDQREHFKLIPSNLEPWTQHSDDQLFPAEIVESLGTDLYLQREYARVVDELPEMLTLHLSYYTGMIDAVPHVPERCFVAGGYELASRPQEVPMAVDRSQWMEDELVNVATGETYQTAWVRDPLGRSRLVRMPVGDFAIRVFEFQDPKKPEIRVFAGYFFVANGRVAVSPADVKVIAFRRSEKYAYYCKVQFATVGGPDFDLDAFVERCSSLLQPLLPEVMKCLPDWSEIEARDHEPAPIT